jgi:hypothetical protein
MTVSGVLDLAGNEMAPTSWSFTTSELISNATLWDGAAPTNAESGGASPVEVGMKFQVIEDGYITGLRFYKGAGNTGVHVGHLWDEHGTPIAIATFTDESDTGWQQVNFRMPVPVSGNTTYIVSYYAPNGGYTVTDDYFGSAGHSNGAVRVLGTGVSGGGGVHYFGVGGAFPASYDGDANYWVDVVFANVPITVVEHSPGRIGNDLTSDGSISAVFSADIIESSLSFVVRDASNQIVQGTVEYDAVTNRVTFHPLNALAASSTYTATVSVVDIWGNAMTPFTWAFTVDDLVATA